MLAAAQIQTGREDDRPRDRHDNLRDRGSRDSRPSSGELWRYDLKRLVSYRHAGVPWLCWAGQSVTAGDRGHGHHHEALLERYPPDLAGQRFYRVLSRFHWAPLVLLGLALLWIGGWPMVL